MCSEFNNDSDSELFKMKFETSYNTLKEQYQNEQKNIKKCKEYISDVALYMSKVQNSQKQVADDEQQKEMMVQELQDKQTRLQHLKQSEIEVA